MYVVLLLRYPIISGCAGLSRVKVCHLVQKQVCDMCTLLISYGYEENNYISDDRFWLIKMYSL